jgi:hypothetical protein
MKRIVAALAVLTVSSLAHADGDSFSEHYDQAIRLMECDQFNDALKELNAAYAVRQLPKVLFQLGTVERRLGHAREALTYFERYLAADETPEPPVRAEAERAIIQLKQLVTFTSPPVPQTQLTQPELKLPIHYEVHHDRGLIGGGIGLLAASYAAALITGSIFASISSNNYDGGNNGSMQAAGGTLIIPVVGPFISALVYREAAWSVPWAMADGVAQVAGLAMIIAGARIKHKVPVLGNLHIAPYASAGGGGLVAVGRF